MLKYITNKNLYDMVLKQIGSKVGRCKESDTNKEMELLIAKEFYGVENITPPKDRIEEYHGIDLWVGDIPVQIKCNKDSKLVLEDNIYRNNEWLPGCIDTCEANTLLKVWPDREGIIAVKDYSVEILKRVLRASRKYYENGTIDPILDFTAGPGKWFQNKDAGGSFFIYS